VTIRQTFENRKHENVEESIASQSKRALVTRAERLKLQKKPAASIKQANQHAQNPPSSRKTG
jgi:hypothetical protein